MSYILISLSFIWDVKVDVEILVICWYETNSVLKKRKSAKKYIIRDPRIYLLVYIYFTFWSIIKIKISLF